MPTSTTTPPSPPPPVRVSLRGGAPQGGGEPAPWSPAVAAAPWRGGGRANATAGTGGGGRAHRRRPPVLPPPSQGAQTRWRTAQGASLRLGGEGGGGMTVGNRTRWREGCHRVAGGGCGARSKGVVRGGRGGRGRRRRRASGGKPLKEGRSEKVTVTTWAGVVHRQRLVEAGLVVGPGVVVAGRRSGDGGRTRTCDGHGAQQRLAAVEEWHPPLSGLGAPPPASASQARGRRGPAEGRRRRKFSLCKSSPHFDDGTRMR